MSDIIDCRDLFTMKRISARLSDRRSALNAFSDLIGRGLRIILCAVIFVQPGLTEMAKAQEIVIDPNGNVGYAAPVLKRASRPQIVDIATPNSGGVSLNQYDRFDVTSRGVVLNNSATTSTTTVAGSVAGNANLTSGSASTIVNEVTSTDDSSLVGPVEVAGARANVVIANPNGITCNGCSFINTDQATLSTGVPTINGGTVTLDVTKGKVTIGRSGLNGAATGVSTVNLLGREVVIDGQVTAVDALNIVGGGYRYDLSKGATSATLAPEGAPASGFAIDATAFGAMEAGRIQIIGTERGFGVRSLGAMQGEAGGVKVSNQGAIEVSSVAAKGAVTIGSSYGEVNVSNDVVSTAADVKITGRRDVVTAEGSGIYGFSGVTINSSKAAVDLNGDLQSGAGLNVSASTTLSFSGLASIADTAAITTSGTAELNGLTLVALALNASTAAADFVLADTAIFTTSDLSLSADDFTLGANVYWAGLDDDTATKLSVTATGDFHNSADLRIYDDFAIDYDGAFYNEANGVLAANAISWPVAGLVQNAGTILSEGTLKLDLSQFTNTETGLISAEGLQITTTGALVNEGAILADGTLKLVSGGDLTNTGYINAASAILSAAKVVNAAAGDIRVAGTLSVSGTTSVSNLGQIGTAANLSVTAPNLTNVGTMIAETSAVFSATNLSNGGSLIAGIDLNVTGRNAITNSGDIAAYHSATLISDATITNTGNLVADATLSIRGAYFLNSGADALVRATSGAITTAKIRNEGSVFLVNDFKRSGDIDRFENYGTFATAGSIGLTGRDETSVLVLAAGSSLIAGLAPVDETQTLISGKSVSTTFTANIIAGTIAAGGNVSLTGNLSAGELLVDGQVQAGGALVLTAYKIKTGTDAVLNASGIGKFTSTQGLANSGAIILGRYIDLYELVEDGGFGGLNNSGVISTERTRTFTLSGDFSNSGVFLTTSGNLTLKARNITNTGLLQSASAVSLTTVTEGARQTLSGFISAERVVTLSGGAIKTSADSTLAAASLNVTGDSFAFYGAGSLDSTARSDWITTGATSIYGSLYAAGELRLIAGSFSTVAGSLLASGQKLGVTADGAISVSGVLTGDKVQLTGTTITTAGTAAISATDYVILTGTSAASLSGELVAGNLLRVAASRFDLKGNAFSNAIELTATAGTGYTRALTSATDKITISTTGDMTNIGEMEAANSIRVTAANLTNAVDSSIQSTDLRATLSGYLHNQGTLFGAHEIDIRAGSLSNYTGATIETVSLGSNLDTYFSNKGKVDTYGFFGDIGGSLNNQGQFRAQTYFGLDAASLYNNTDGLIDVLGGYLYVNVIGEMVNDTDRVIRADKMDLNAGTLTNKGTLRGSELVNLDVTGAFTNAEGAAIYGDIISVSATGAITNAGSLGYSSTSNALYSEEIYIAGQSWLSNTGAIRGAELKLSLNDKITNATSAIIEARDTIGLQSRASDLENLGIIRGPEVYIDVAKTLYNKNLINGTELLTISANALSNYNPVTTSTVTAVLKGNQTTIAVDTWLTNYGEISGWQNLSLHSGGTTTNYGAIYGQEISILADGGRFESFTKLTSGGKIVVNANNVLLHGGATVTDAISLVARAGDVSVGGTLSTKALYVEAADDVYAAAKVFKGSVSTTVIADDILRYEGSTPWTGSTTLASGYVFERTNAKLGTFDPNQNDLYVKLREGSLGSFGSLSQDIDELTTVGDIEIGQLYSDRINSLVGIIATYIDTRSGWHLYESSPINATGSIALIADQGDILLAGQITAGKDIYVQAGQNIGLKNLTLNAGSLVHLEASRYLKNYGGVTLNPGNKLELMQTYGWFYTSDWFGREVPYNVTVFAGTIAVTGDHRFAAYNDAGALALKSLTLSAYNSLWQRDHVVIASGITYSAGGGILIEFDPFSWRANNASRLSNLSGDWWDLATAGADGRTLQSGGGGITLYAAANANKLPANFDTVIAGINLISGKIRSGGDLAIVSEGRLISQPMYLVNDGSERPEYVGWAFDNSIYQARISTSHDWGRIDLEELRAYENQLSAAGNVSLSAGGNIELIGSQITSSNGDLTVQSLAGTVMMIAAPGEWVYHYDKTTTKRKWWGKKTTKTYTYDADRDVYKRTALKALNGTISISSAATLDSEDYTILSAGTEMSAKSVTVSTRSGVGSIWLGTYAETNTMSASTRTRSSWLGITYRKSSSTHTETGILQTGNNLLADEILTLSSSQNLRITGGTLSGTTVRLSAANDLIIEAAINSTASSSFTQKQNLITITTIQEGFERETAELPQIFAPNIEYDLGGEVHIQGARGATLNDQLVTAIGTHDFSDILPELYTTSQANAAADATKAVADQFTRAFVLPTAADGAQFSYLDTLVRDYDAQYDTILLRDHSWYDKQVQLTPAFQALLSITVTYLTGGVGGSLGLQGVFASGFNAALSSTITGVIGGTITGDIDMDMILRGAILAGAGASINTYLTQKIDLGDLLGASDTSPFVNDLQGHFSPGQLLDRLGDRIVSNGVTNVLNGQDFFEGLDDLGRTFLVTETMGVLQFGIGELGAGQGDWEGSLPHMLLHGGFGCVAMEVMDGNCASGFFAGASSSVLAGSGLTDQQKLDLAPVVGAWASFFWSDGKAVNVSFASTLAQSAVVNNYLTHKDVEEAEALNAECRVNQSEKVCDQRVVDFLAKRSEANDRALIVDCNYDPVCIKGFTYDTANDLITGAELLHEDSDLSVALRNRIVASGAANYGASVLELLPLTDEDRAYIASQPAELQVISVAETLSEVTPEEFWTRVLAGGAVALSPVVAARLMAACTASPVCSGLLGRAAISAELATGVADLAACADGDLVSCATAVGPGSTLSGALSEARLFDNTFVTAEEYATYVARKEAKGEVPRSVAEYIAAREHFAVIQANHNTAVKDLDSYLVAGGARTEREVTLIAPDGTRARTDIIAFEQKPGATFTVPNGYRAEDIYGNVLTEPVTFDASGALTIEVKTGGAGLTCNQACVYEYQVTGGEVVAAGQYSGTTVPSNVVVLRRIN
ncbi:filamentous hemagglutinin N-terminal domain-containing protein [Thioclava sp. GXIMD4216]|uniref:two-partner secretion domain-containing protein n=1 Tax=Thioclava sp. GXIMD4216 TaxID=3131929 RepID=UPI0030CCD71B